jgi:hypothetical protein
MGDVDDPAGDPDDPDDPAGDPDCKGSTCQGRRPVD